MTDPFNLDTRWLAGWLAGWLAVVHPRFLEGLKTYGGRGGNGPKFAHRGNADMVRVAHSETGRGGTTREQTKETRKDWRRPGAGKRD